MFGFVKKIVVKYAKNEEVVKKTEKFNLTEWDIIDETVIVTKLDIIKSNIHFVKSLFEDEEQKEEEIYNEVEKAKMIEEKKIKNMKEYLIEDNWEFLELEDKSDYYTDDNMDDSMIGYINC